MWMYFATLAYFLCGVYIISESHWGEGLKPGMYSISPQEAENGSLPLPHAQISPSHAQLAGYWMNYSTKVRDSYSCMTQRAKYTSQYAALDLLCFIKDIYLWYVLQFHCTKFHMTLQKYWKAFFFLIKMYWSCLPWELCFS